MGLADPFEKIVSVASFRFGWKTRFVDFWKVALALDKKTYIDRQMFFCKVCWRHTALPKMTSMTQWSYQLYGEQLFLSLYIQARALLLGTPYSFCFSFVTNSFHNDFELRGFSMLKKTALVFPKETGYVSIQKFLCQGSSLTFLVPTMLPCVVSVCAGCRTCQDD